MAEALHELKEKKKAKSKSNNKAGNRTRGGTAGSSAARTATNKASEGTRQGETAATDGAEELKQAVDKEVGRKSKKLAKVLMDKAMEGDLASAKLLVTLAESKRPIKEVAQKPTGPTLAQRLAAEPPWTGPLPGEKRRIETESRQ